MKKNIPLLLMSLLFFMPVDAQEQKWCDESCIYEKSCCVGVTNFYAKILGGANFLQNIPIRESNTKYKAGYIIAGSLGYCWHYGLNLEAEYAFRMNELKKIHFFGEGSSTHGQFQTSSFMANLLWDLPLPRWGCACNIQPFIGAGIGYDAQQIYSSNSRIVFNQKWNHLSWQVMTGLAYQICCDTELTLEYKFHQGGSHFNNHTVGLGLVYKFGCLR